MRRGSADFRCRYGAAMNRARTIERQAGSLREDLARRACGERDRLEVQRTIEAMRHQLELAERLADEFHCALEFGHTEARFHDGSERDEHGR